MRGVADKLLLPVEQRFGPGGIPPGGIVQPTELHDLRIGLERRIGRTDRIGVEPPQQGVKRLHRAVQDDGRHDQNQPEQQHVQSDDPPQYGPDQFGLLDRRRRHRQFAPLPRTVAEHHPQHAGRLLIVPFGNIDLLVRKYRLRARSGIAGRYLEEFVPARTAPFGCGGVSGKHLTDDHFGAHLQRIVHLTVDPGRQGKIEQHGPHRQQQREHPCQVQDDAVDKSHGRTSL